MRKPFADRFWSYVDPHDDPNGCWNWIGKARAGGYGQVYVSGRMRLAHRVSYALEHGPIPEGLHVLHACDNRLCVNPYHLSLGTNAENMADRNAKGRQAHLRGETNGNHRLTEADVLAIRTSSERQRVLALRYGIKQGVISAIRLRKTWKHVA